MCRKADFEHINNKKFTILVISTLPLRHCITWRTVGRTSKQHEGTRKKVWNRNKNKDTKRSESGVPFPDAINVVFSVPFVYLPQRKGIVITFYVHKVNMISLRTEDQRCRQDWRRLKSCTITRRKLHFTPLARTWRLLDSVTGCWLFRLLVITLESSTNKARAPPLPCSPL